MIDRSEPPVQYPFERDIWDTWHRQKFLLVSSRCHPEITDVSFQEVKNREEFERSRSSEIAYFDLAFLLRYCRMLHLRGYGHFPEISSMLNAVSEQFPVCDTLQINFRNIYASMAKGSGGVYIK
jgi:hypothetical protein